MITSHFTDFSTVEHMIVLSVISSNEYNHLVLNSIQHFTGKSISTFGGNSVNNLTELTTMFLYKNSLRYFSKVIGGHST